MKIVVWQKKVNLKTYSLFELNEYIRRVLALNLPEAFWVTGELSQVDHSRGHWYFSLVEKAETDDEIIAQMPGVLWYQSFRQLRFRLGDQLDSLLQEGIEVRLKVRVDYHERFGLKVVAEDIDPEYTLGRLAAQRQWAIERLKAEGLLGRNATLPFPLVAQRIAVLSSENAAGYQDFLDQLHNNPYGYTFQTVLFPIAVQGQLVAIEAPQQLRRLGELRHLFDCAVIIRGGGARTDLSAFDQYEVGKAIAQCLLPILTGIGHETDSSLADQTAHQSLKTPTAVADFIIQHNAQFEGSLLSLGRQVQRQVNIQFTIAGQQLSSLHQRALLASRHQLGTSGRQLDQYVRQIPLLAARLISGASRELEQLEKMKNLLSLEATLNRGFTLTTHKGKPTNATALKSGDKLITRFKDGDVESLVE